MTPASPLPDAPVTLYRETVPDACPRCHGQARRIPEFGGCDHDWHEKPTKPATYRFWTHNNFVQAGEVYRALPAPAFDALVARLAAVETAARAVIAHWPVRADDYDALRAALEQPK